MSEYQYFEFAAIDRPLTRAEMATLRSVSTRAVITPTGFVNHYEWGDLKADPADLMRRYFDAFVYTANWCSCRLALRVPRSVLGKSGLAQFVTENSLTVEAEKDCWILEWALDESEDYGRFADDDGRGWMRRLAPLREELLRGDLRPLYLGWLAGADSAGTWDDALEPEVPAGLSALSPAQQALVEFLEIDPDMLAAAAVGSTPLQQADVELASNDGWLEDWSRDEMAAVLKLIAQGCGQDAERRVRSRLAAWLKAQRSMVPSSPRRRSVAELREIAKSACKVRMAREAKARAKQESELRRLRETQLRRLMFDAAKQWAAIDVQAKRGSAAGYDQAVRALVDLAAGYELTSSVQEFEREMRRFRLRHAKRGALLRRLAEAGLWSE